MLAAARRNYEMNSLFGSRRAQEACGERSRIIEPLYSQELLEIIPDEGKMLLVDYLTIHYYPKQQLILYWRLKRDALHTSVQGVF